MNGLFYINVTAEIICGIICLILLLCVVTAEYRKDKLHRSFVLVISCLIPLLAVDTAIFCWEESSEPISNRMLRTMYGLSFILGAALLLILTLYLLDFLKTKTTVSGKIKRLSQAAMMVCLLNILCIVLTQFNGMYYIITAGNTFMYGDWYWLSQALAVCGIAMNTGIIWIYRKCFEKRDLTLLSFYALLPILALVVQNIIEGVSAAVDVAATLTIIIFYAIIQSEQAKRLKAHELELAEKRIAVMISQIQPHFLYNSLTGIMELCVVDGKQAELALAAFSKYLRGNLDSLSLTTAIPFTTELEHVKIYLSLEKLRFGDRLHIVYEITAQAFTLPALSLQPIVENAVKHGITKKRSGGTVTIRTAESADAYTITVTDDGAGFTAERPSQGGDNPVGIENTKARLSMMCGGTLEIQSSKGAGTTAVITLPKGGAHEYPDSRR